MPVVDFHNHLLAGVDDGAHTDDESRAALYAMAAEGVAAVITTPHVDASLALQPERLSARLHELDVAWRKLLATAAATPVTVYRGAELALDVPDPDFADQRLRLAGTRFVLVEFAHMTVPPNASGALRRIRDRGWIPVLAHPERYAGGSVSAVQSWRDAGALLQLNGPSLVGRYGVEPKRLAEQLLAHGLADYICSDYHSRSGPYIDEYIRWLRQCGGGEQAALLTGINPQRLLQDELPMPVPPLFQSRGLWCRMRSRLRWIGTAVLLLVGLAGGRPVAAQAGPVFLGPGHWSYDAIRRLTAAGVAPASSDHALAPVTRWHALRVFTAAEAAAADRPVLSRRAAGYRRLLLAEGDTSGLLAGSRLSAGWVAARGEALGGDGYYIFEDWEGARPLPAVSAPLVAWSGWGHLHPRVAWNLDAGQVAGRLTIRTATVAAAAGPVDLWAGRRAMRYGIGRGGGTVLGGALLEPPDLAHRTTYTFQGIGGQVREPFHFPAFLRFLGPARIEASLGRIARNGLVDGPWVAFGRLTGSPFTDRIVLGINRGAIFGGADNPVTPGRLVGLLIGVHGGHVGEFENQVFSTILGFRPPLGPHLPLALYVEWGMDDTADAVRDVPAVVAGVDLAAVPGLPALSLGVERTSFAQSCCGNPIWYRSVFFRGSWADGGRLFAHPLGGHGREWLAHAALALPAHGAVARADLFRRERYHENLFAFERMGGSTGVAASVQLWRGPHTVRIDGTVERGDGWSLERLAAAFSVSLGGR
jgi:protein-tyrosine phosphatase